MRERIGWIATRVLVGTVLGLGLDIGPKYVDAQTSTPTATPISTPTPDKEIISKQATITALNEQLERARKLAELRVTETDIRDAINAALGTPTPTATLSAQELERQRVEQAVIKEIADRRTAADTTLAERQAKLKKLDEAIERVNQRLADRELEADAAAERRLTADTNIQDVAVRIGAGVTGGFLGGLLVGRLWGGIRRRIGGVVRGIFRRGGGGTPPAGPHDPLGTI